jgi:hypothetical protein
MKIQMTVAGVVATSFTAAVAASYASTETRTTAFILIGTIGAGYIENLTLSSTAYLWDPADMGEWEHITLKDIGLIHVGLVTGVLGAIRTAVSAIATSMYSSILATEAAKYLPQKVIPAAVSAGLPSSSLATLFEAIQNDNLTAVPGISQDIIAAVDVAVKDAYARSYQTVYLCTLPFGALLIISALFSPNVEQYLTDEVARKLHPTATAETDEEVTARHVEKH